MDKNKLNKILSEVYYDIGNPAGFASALKLFKAVKIKHPQITLNEVKHFLSSQLTYTLHKKRRVRFKRNKVMVEHVSEQFQADLVDMQSFSKSNDNYKYILTVIDILSKYAFAIPIKNKTNKEVIPAFKRIFDDRKPTRLQTDQGTEFISRELLKFYKENEIQFFTAKNPATKATNVERFNRTLKAKMFKVFSTQGTYRYLDILPKIVSAYNKTIHRATGMRPVDVTHKNEHLAFQKLYGYKNKREYLKSQTVKSKHRVGDTVRLQYDKTQFEKGYLPVWTDQTDEITEISNVGKPTYKLKDGNRRYYEDDIQVIGDKPEYRVQDVIKVRTRQGIREYFVSWLNYPPSANSWIKAKDVRAFK